ncbi:AzlD domain-containing protein [Lederbergia wuyishanensis]|uniref:Branched-subunit amino acid transport protein n=1 Tax=Lederbergia wuyishanensis TaxID=1347903 RepID=A0ABU0DAA5_9BACI|nr:AzlD domain-containing protein [Lederbergia wuyishanensis]MCJ8010091.1 AzlD domain-containing protein [Lederbergia wuyishanensis]MDQ0345330.1 branched-subunit amino acid transport protein [Lederbergia wuyishanensis]
MHSWLLIGLLAVSTFLSRIVGVSVMAGNEMNPTLRLYFSYVPIAIMTALIVKQIFMTTNEEIVISLPVLAACLATAITIKLTKLFLPSVVIGVMIGLVVRFLF